jgi:hypothetical protein
MVWNIMLGEGLLAYGYTSEAAELVGRLMDACAASLTTEQGFREIYHPDQPQSVGHLGHLAGIAPVGLFLETLGIKFLSPSKMMLRGDNPFGETITVRWRGIEVLASADHKDVRFQGGESTQISGEKWVTVQWE